MDSDRLLNSAEVEEMKNFYKCRLTCLVPKTRAQALTKTVTKLTSWFDPYQQIVAIDENAFPEKEKKGHKIKGMQTKGCLVSPAISVMLYVREVGEMCVRDAERILKKPPWKFHHKVELQNKSCPKTSLAKQEFFKLGADLPLFAVCPVLTENEHLRISLYVHDFNSMVEFYRLITDTEMETHKPEFCIFQIYQQPGLDVQLSLKRSKYIFPVPVESAYVSFNVKNIEAIKLGLKNEVRHMNGNVYTTRDPDGNLVVLYETSTGLSDVSSSVTASASFLADTLLSVDDLKSLKSTAESHDSGRFSDPDDVLMPEERAKNVQTHEVRTVSEASDGYESSVNLSVASDVQVCDNTSKRSLKNGVTVLKRNHRFGESKQKDVVSGDSRKDEKGSNDFAPVYI